MIYGSRMVGVREPTLMYDAPSEQFFFVSQEQRYRAMYLSQEIKSRGYLIHLKAVDVVGRKKTI
jgi:hypothetical protein